MAAKSFNYKQTCNFLDKNCNEGTVFSVSFLITVLKKLILVICLSIRQSPSWVWHPYLIHFMRVWNIYTLLGNGKRTCSVQEARVALSYRLARHLSPGQTKSQVDASWKLGSACDSLWPGLACTCADLRWIALTLLENKFGRKSKQVFHRLATPTQVSASWVTFMNLLWTNKIENSLPCFISDLRVLARKLDSSFGHPKQVSTQVQLASTCDYLPVRLTRALPFFRA